MTIDTAVKAFRTGKPEVALEALLEVWRKSRAPELAEAIAAVGAQVDATRPKIPAKKAERIAAWKKVAAKRDGADLGPLLAALDGLVAADGEPLVIVLQRWPADPRIADGLFALLDSPPTGMRGRKAEPFWRAVLLAIENVGDPRTGDRRTALAGKIAGDASERSGLQWADSSEVLRASLAAVKTRPAPKVKALTAKDKALLADLKPAVRGDVGLLYAKVYAEPHDDGARHILADALLESGDPRGELISLQLLPKLDAAQRKRAKQLLDANARKWLGPLEPAVLKSGLVYRRGFPAEAKLSTNQASVVKALIGRPEWGTFEELDVESWPKESRKEFVSQRLPALKRVIGLQDAADLPDHSVKWEELKFLRAAPKEMADFEKVKTLPQLKVLELHYVYQGPFPSFWKSEIARGLEAVHGGFTLRDWAHNAPPNITGFHDFKTSARRTPQGLAVEINCDWTQDVVSSYGSEIEAVKDVLFSLKIKTKEVLPEQEKKGVAKRAGGAKLEFVP
jgi:uncharacterized protein (TIGR02996 family)